jgi:hypothetical protein
VSEAFGTAIDESRSADIHFSVRPSRVLREGAKNGGASRLPRGARTHLQGGTVATLAGVDGDDAVERRADAAEAREANLRREGGGSTVRQKVVGHWYAQVLGFICFR